MKATRQCPICYNELEMREVTPCYDCGAREKELDHFRDGKHKYREYEVFPGVFAVLCDFCDVDFGSYDPAYWGLPRNAKIGFEKMRFIRDLDTQKLVKDLFCAECGRRLAFLKFLVQARQVNNSNP